MFADRIDAGRQLAGLLVDRGDLGDAVVVGLPRGGVPVAAEVARALHAPLDVIVVRKLGVPFQPELAMGAIGEDGVRVLDESIVAAVGVSPDELAAVERTERGELERRAETFRRGRRRTPLAGRTVIVVDDGIATGSTARAACLVARAEGARRVILAVPVAPADWIRRLSGVADDFVAVQTPFDFAAVGQFYRRFAQTTDTEVVAALDAAASRDPTTDGPPEGDTDVSVSTDDVRLAGRLTVPAGAAGVVVFAHGSGSSRHSPRNRYVADVLVHAGIATLLFDLLTAREELDRANVFDVDRLATRLVGATRWLRGRRGFESLPLGYFGASTGAAAALAAAAEAGDEVSAVVSRGGRPDLAGARLPKVTAPTLLIVGEHDPVVHDLNAEAMEALTCEHRLAVIPGATHLFSEPGTLEAVAGLARDWFATHLGATG